MMFVGGENLSAPSQPSMRRYVFCEDGQRPDLFADETMDFEMKDVMLAFNSEKSLGVGELFITSRRVIWIKNDEFVGDQHQVAVDIDVPFIVLHAITRDPDSFAKPCVYCQLSGGDGGELRLENEDNSEAEDDELFIVPPNEAGLTAIFNALSHAALVNPDPPEDGEEEGDDEFIYNIDEVALGAEQARVLNHLESVFRAPEGDEEEGEEGQFDDADEV